MAFFKKRRRKRGKATTKSRIQEIKSPYAHRKVLSKKKLPKKLKKTKYSSELKLSYKKHFPLKKWLIIIGSIIGVLLILYATVFSNFFQVRNWKIFGNDIIQENSKFEDFLRIQRGKNLVFLDTTKIEKTIIDQYSEVENIRIKKVFPDTLLMEFENFPEAANLTNISSDTQKKFIINETGFLVQEDFENPNLPYIKLQTEKILEVNSFAIKREKLEYILDAIYDYEEIFGMKILDAEYKATERELHLHTERDFFIWLDVELALTTQFEKLRQARTNLNIFTDNLEYIDLRISSVNGERVIFKRR